jgi:hypothetical protein
MVWSMGRKDPVLEELFEVVRRDLEEVVNGEVENVRRVLGCVDAKVYENAIYIEVSVLGGLVVDLPSQHRFYIKKANVREVLLEVDVLRDTMNYVLARIHLWYLQDQEQTCYMDVEIFPYRIEELAKHIVLDLKAWSEGGSNE